MILVAINEPQFLGSPPPRYGAIFPQPGGQRRTMILVATSEKDPKPEPREGSILPQPGGKESNPQSLRHPSNSAQTEIVNLPPNTHICLHDSIPNRYRICDSTTLEILAGQEHGLTYDEAKELVDNNRRLLFQTIGTSAKKPSREQKDRVLYCNWFSVWIKCNDNENDEAGFTTLDA